LASDDPTYVEDDDQDDDPVNAEPDTRPNRNTRDRSPPVGSPLLQAMLRDTYEDIRACINDSRVKKLNHDQRIDLIRYIISTFDIQIYALHQIT